MELLWETGRLDLLIRGSGEAGRLMRKASAGVAAEVREHAPPRGPHAAGTEALEWSDEEEGAERENQCLSIELGVGTGEGRERGTKQLKVYTKKKEEQPLNWDRGLDAMDRVTHSKGSQERGGRGHAGKDVGRIVRELRRGLYLSDPTEPCLGATGAAAVCQNSGTRTAERARGSADPRERET
ncbi:hypothetical protein NDU88_007896 [Pleurodeles waltl]|uniref:Uncharacterized protein n=1 Tax=Pleurodeles waltl TaxID=8319 RepID=A0AAV7RRL5_PLEWA|nr:hypothetical protein NDU88_007896 [Pleurodeles waltl]